jgi:hypothetical protein
MYLSSNTSPSRSSENFNIAEKKKVSLLLTSGGQFSKIVIQSDKCDGCDIVGAVGEEGSWECPQRYLFYIEEGSGETDASRFCYEIFNS